MSRRAHKWPTMPDGNIVTTWAQLKLNGAWDVFGQILSKTGQKIGGEFKVTTYSANGAGNHRVEVLGEDKFIVVYHTTGSLMTKLRSEKTLLDKFLMARAPKSAMSLS